MDITWISRGCIFIAVQFSHEIHVTSVISSTWIRLSFMSGYPLANQYEFYVAYLYGSDVDSTDYLCREYTE